MWDCEGWEPWGWDTWQDKISHAGGADGAVVQEHGTSLPGTAWTLQCDTRGEHGDNCEVQCVPDVRKKPHFTHVRGNLRGDVSGKRFSTHVGEGNVAGVAQELLSDGTGCTVTWVPSRDTATGYRHRAQSLGTRHRVLS